MDRCSECEGSEILILCILKNKLPLILKAVMSGEENDIAFHN